MSLQTPDLTRAPRQVAWVTSGCAAALLLVLALWLVPWSPVPGGTLQPADPDSIFTASEIARAEEFSRWSRTWSWSSLVVSLVAVCLLGLTGRGRRWVSRPVNRVGGPWWLRVVLAVAVVEVAVRLLTLPFGIQQRRHLRAYGLSTQDWGGYAIDLLKNELIDILVLSLALVAVLGCARVWRRAWPAIAAALAAGLVLAGSFAYPVVIEPLFNSFTPLPAGELRTRILAVAEQEGVGVDEVLVADASRRTTTLNAYVSGFGGTRRVVLYDNLVEDVPADQVISVVAHELAHAHHSDVVVGSVLGAAGAGLAVGALGLVLAGVRRRGGPTPEGPPERLPALVAGVLALFAVVSLAASPVQNGISRQIEIRADVDALRVTDDPDSFIALQRQLAVRSLSDPTPVRWAQFWFGSHPTTLTRVALAQRVREE